MLTFSKCSTNNLTINPINEKFEPTQKNRIDSQIASTGIQPPIVGELHLSMSTIGDQIDPQRGHLEVDAIVDSHGDSAMLLTVGVDGTNVCLLHHLLHLIGRRSRRQIDVFWHSAHEQVAHCATCDP